MLGALCALVGSPGLALPAHAATPRTTTTGVLAWGINVYGQLGTSGVVNRSAPAPTLNLSGVVGIAAGGEANLAIESDGTVWSWGRNDHGELGTTPAPELCNHILCSSVPVKTGLTKIVSVAAGDEFGLALTSSGTVWAWGDNFAGELGNPSIPQTGSVTPVQVPGLSGVKAIAANESFAMALTTSGALYTWGDNTFGQLGLGCASSVATGACEYPIPTQVTALGTNVIAIAAGRSHALAVTSDGAVHAWGDNTFGELGVPGNPQSQPTPQLVPGVSGVAAVAAGLEFNLALTTAGTVYAWGLNDDGELGTGSNVSYLTGVFTPTLVSGLSGVSEIAARSTHSMALTTSGAVYAWGDNKYGELGVPSSDSCHSVLGVHPCSITPQQVPGASGATAIAAGSDFSLAIVPVALPTPTTTPIPPMATPTAVPPMLTTTPITPTPIPTVRTSPVRRPTGPTVHTPRGDISLTGKEWWRLWAKTGGKSKPTKLLGGTYALSLSARSPYRNRACHFFGFLDSRPHRLSAFTLLGKAGPIARYRPYTEFRTKRLPRGTYVLQVSASTNCAWNLYVIRLGR